MLHSDPIPRQLIVLSFRRVQTLGILTMFRPITIHQNLTRLRAVLSRSYMQPHLHHNLRSAFEGTTDVGLTVLFQG